MSNLLSGASASADHMSARDNEKDTIAEDGELGEDGVQVASTSAIPQPQTISTAPHRDRDNDSDINSSGPPSPADDGRVDSAEPRAETPISTDVELTMEQMHQAKMLMLDLLGWGVPPEYMLDRGVSHKLLQSVFADLNLRLPETAEDEASL